MRSLTEKLFGIDLRSLALFRIGLALILLWDLFDRAADLFAHYTDFGVLPRSIAINIMDPWHLSLHLISGTWQIQLVLFILAGFAAIALLIGYKTRIATILSWILLISLHSRNPLVLQGGDIVLRLFLFWAIFLPLGSYLAVDQKKEPAPSNLVFSLATIAILLQVCFIYWFSALLKTDASWRSDGSAVWYAFNVEQYTKPFGIYLLQYPSFLKLLTFSTFYLEALGPFFAFIPIKRVFFRMMTVMAFLSFHLIGLNFTMELAHFPYICAIGWLVFIPLEFWDKIWKYKEEKTLSYWKGGRATNFCASFFILYILMWNLGTLGGKFTQCQKVECIGNLARVDQYWNMFSPYPLREDGWYVIPAKLRNGEEIDLLTEKKVTFDKPPSLARAYPNDRWRSYLMNLFLENHEESHFLYYARYLTRKWNMNHAYERQALTFDIYYMLKITEKEGPCPPEKVHLWEHDCFAEN